MPQLALALSEMAPFRAGLSILLTPDLGADDTRESAGAHWPDSGWRR